MPQWSGSVGAFFEEKENMEDQIIDIPVEQKDIKLEDKRFNIKLDRDGKEFVFSVPDGTPFGAAYDACLQILLALKDMINKSAESIVAESQPKDIQAEVVNESN